MIALNVAISSQGYWYNSMQVHFVELHLYKYDFFQPRLLSMRPKIQPDRQATPIKNKGITV